MAVKAPARARERAREALEAPPRRTLLAVGAAISAFLVFFPAKQLIGEHLRVTRLEARLQALKAENDQIQAQVKRLQDPAELELIARERLGLVKPGERAYLLVPQETAKPQAPKKVEPATWYERLWDRAWSLVRGRGS